MKENKAQATKRIINFDNGIVGVDVAGRPGIQKCHLDGHSAFQRYIRIPGTNIDISVKQEQGLDVPAFNWAIPSNIVWKESPTRFGGTVKTATFEVSAGTIPVKVGLRQRVAEPASGQHVAQPAQAQPATKPAAQPLPPKSKPAVKPVTIPMDAAAPGREEKMQKTLQILQHKAPAVKTFRITPALRAYIDQTVRAEVAAQLAAVRAK